jgi:hypothetical protein
MHFNRANILPVRQATSKSGGYVGAATITDKKPAPAETQTKTPAATNKSLTISNMKYCFTHGLNFSHFGHQCKRKCNTHDDTAQVNNMKGGSATISRRKGEVQLKPPLPPGTAANGKRNNKRQKAAEEAKQEG